MSDNFVVIGYVGQSAPCIDSSLDCCMSAEDTEPLITISIISLPCTLSHYKDLQRLLLSLLKQGVSIFSIAYINYKMT